MEEKKIKTIIALAILVFILLSGNLIVSIIQEIDYNKRKKFWRYKMATSRK